VEIKRGGIIGLAQAFALKHPLLKSELKKAGINKTPEEFMSLVLLQTFSKHGKTAFDNTCSFLFHFFLL
jgi:hypothetical protein